MLTPPLDRHASSISQPVTSRWSMAKSTQQAASKSVFPHSVMSHMTRHGSQNIICTYSARALTLSDLTHEYSCCDPLSTERSPQLQRHAHHFIRLLCGASIMKQFTSPPSCRHSTAPSVTSTNFCLMHLSRSAASPVRSASSHASYSSSRRALRSSSCSAASSRHPPSRHRTARTSSRKALARL